MSLTSLVSGQGVGYSAMRIAMAAASGGTVSELTSGKFGNGAVSAAFSQAFNEEAHYLDNIEKSKAALATIFGDGANGVQIVTDSSRAKAMGVYATTSVNTIYVNDSLSGFFDADFTVLEEHYHVLRQWNTGAMSKSSYLYELMKNGYDNNKYEIEAKGFAKENLQRYRDLKND